MKTFRIVCVNLLVLLAIIAIGTLNSMATDTKAVKDMAGSATTMMDTVNLNTASADVLAKIPGVGEKIGNAITTYHESAAAFKSVNDLINVEGIDTALLEKIKPFVSI